jgi:tetratricopeptide (TPR) repeat protein
MESGKNNGNASALARALYAAEHGRRDELLKVLQGVQLNDGPDASFDERWLAAERAYGIGDYAGALTRFSALEHDPASANAPAWQQFLSWHRRSFASLKVGDVRQARDAVCNAERVLHGAPELQARKATVEAMWAHLFEKENDFEGALARFRLAYRDALSVDDWGRAATAASDVARVLGVLGRPDDAMRWLDLALAARREHPDRLGELTIQFRRGMLHAMLGRVQDALNAYTTVIDAAAGDDATQDVLMDALAQRADLLLRERRFDHARADRLRALRIAKARKLREAIIFNYANLALLYSTRGKPGDSDRARAAFERALRSALDLTSPQPFVFLQLGRDILNNRDLAPQYAAMRGRLDDAVQRLETLTRPSLYFQANRAQQRERAAAWLVGVLRDGSDPPVTLATSTINMRSGTVTRRNGITRLNPAEREVLRVLLGHKSTGLSVEAIAQELAERTPEAIRKSLSRIRGAVDGDLVVTREGNRRLYSVRLA